jgi:CRISPR-associated protein Csm1
MNDDELQLIFLLHDLGIFFKRTGLPPSQKFSNLTESEIGKGDTHSIWSASLAEELGLSQDIQNVILYHHNPDSLKGENGRIANAIGQAAEFFAEGDELGPVNLRSIFSEVKLKEGTRPEEYYLPIQKLDLAFDKPIKHGEISNKEGYQRLWEDFRSELRNIGKDIHPEDLYPLIKKYTIFLPSISRDISLYDYIKVKTAIATCIYSNMQDASLVSTQGTEKPFLLISGGISGIQRFIYRVSSPAEAQVGMARRLRGRSFYLNLLNDTVSTLILKQLKLPETNLLWCGGGSFFIIAPNIKGASDIVNNFQKKVNKSLMEDFNAELFLNFTYEKAGIDELKEFSKANDSLIKKLNENKKQKFIEDLICLFEEDKSFAPKTCPVCANPMEEEDSFCEYCEKHTKLGGHLAHARYYIKTIPRKIDEKNDKEKAKEFDFYFFGVGYKFIGRENLLKEILEISDLYSSVQILKINDTDFVDTRLINKCSELNLPTFFGFTFLANTVPKHKYEMLSFTNIAELSRGADKLGILKMDVDNLGKIFSGGFDNKSTGIARISTMSTMLDFYFSGILNRVCERHYFLDEAKICENCRKEAIEIKLSPENENEAPEIVYRMKEGKHACNLCLEKKSPAIYVNYAGGDDLLIIGPWDLIIQLSKDIRETFKGFTCQNPDINISAGVSIINKKFPIGRAALLAGEALEKSKNNEKSINFHERKKDSISVFGETVFWDTKEDLKGFYDLLDFSTDLEKFIENKQISKGFVYSLLEMWNSNFGYDKRLNNKVRREKKCYVPYLKYQLARNVRDENLRNDLDKRIQKNFPWIKIPVSWVSLRTR